MSLLLFRRSAVGRWRPQQAIVGDAEAEPIKREAEIDDMEIARRIALVLALADPASSELKSIESTVSVLEPKDGGSGSVVDATAALPGPSNDPPDAVVEAGKGDEKPSEAKLAELQVGEIAYVAGYSVECHRPSRPVFLRDI